MQPAPRSARVLVRPGRCYRLGQRVPWHRCRYGALAHRKSVAGPWCDKRKRTACRCTVFDGEDKMEFWQSSSRERHAILCFGLGSRTWALCLCLPSCFRVATLLAPGWVVRQTLKIVEHKTQMHHLGAVICGDRCEQLNFRSQSVQVKFQAQESLSFCEKA